MDDFSNGIAAAFKAIAASPWVFFATLCILAAVIWKVIDWAYSTRLANLKSSNELMEKQLNRRMMDETIVIESSTRQHERRKDSLSEPTTEIVAAAATLPNGDAIYVPETFTPESALAMFEGKTNLQANAALKPYIGQRMVVEHPIVQVSASGNEILITMAAGLVQLVFCYFSHDTGSLRHLSVNDLIRVDGRIARIDALGVELVDCRRDAVLS